jgi:hypothetical protein
VVHGVVVIAEDQDLPVEGVSREKVPIFVCLASTRGSLDGLPLHPRKDDAQTRSIGSDVGPGKQRQPDGSGNGEEQIGPTLEPSVQWGVINHPVMPLVWC